MQLILILGIAFAIGAVMFALQNNVPVTVTFFLWRFDSSLAIVLLLALGLGAIIAGLLSSPAVIKSKWAESRLRRQIVEMESERDGNSRRIGELETELARHEPERNAVAVAAEPKSYVGLKTLIAGGDAGNPKE